MHGKFSPSSDMIYRRFGWAVMRRLPTIYIMGMESFPFFIIFSFEGMSVGGAEGSTNFKRTT